MAIYIPSVDGYIIDNPNIEFQRCDGKIYAYDEVNVANFTDTANSLIINGGQRRSPLSYVDTDRNTEISFTSSLFTLEMFEMANAENIETGDFSTIESKLLNVDSADEMISYAPKSGGGVRVQWELGTMPCIRLNYLIDPATVRIKGLSYQQNLIDEDSGHALVPPGHFGVLVSKGELDRQKKRYYDYLPSIAVGDVWSTIILCNASDVALDDSFRVTYKRSIMSGDRVSAKTNGTTAKGAFWIHWPVYSSGADCTQSNQKGILHLWMPRCRITQTPGLEGSYKTAQAIGITAAAIDPKRPDKKLFVCTYEPLENGEIVNKSSRQQLTDILFKVVGVDITLTPDFNGGIHEYTATIPSERGDNDPLALHLLYEDTDYDTFSVLSRGEAWKAGGFPKRKTFSWLKLSEFRALAQDGIVPIEISMSGEKVPDVHYTINVSV